MRNLKNRPACPEETELRALAAGPQREELAEVAEHVWGCRTCSEKLLSLVMGDVPAEMTPAEKDFIERFTSQRCRSAQAEIARINAFVAARRLSFVTRPVEYAMAAAPAAATTSAEATPGGLNEEVRFVFAAEGSAGVAEFWRAELTIPPNAAPETMLPVRVTGYDRMAVPAGMLRLAGCALPLTDGCASLPFSLFLDGIRDTNVSLCRPDAEPVAGRLLFF